MQRRMYRFGGILGLFVFLMAGCTESSQTINAAGTNSAKAVTADPYRGWEKHGEFGLYSLMLPSGWTKAVDDSRDPRVIVYKDQAGYFFSLTIWPENSRRYGEFEADRVWRLEWLDESHTAYRVISKEPSCKPFSNPSGLCLVGNGSTEVHVMLMTQVQAEKYGGSHEYQFDFGQRTVETEADDPLFEKILESFKIT